MRRRAPISLWRTLAIYVLGLVAGTQVALYLYDRYDDGVAEPLSGALGALFVLVGIVAVAWTYRGREEDQAKLRPDDQAPE